MTATAQALAQALAQTWWVFAWSGGLVALAMLGGHVTGRMTRRRAERRGGTR